MQRTEEHNLANKMGGHNLVKKGLLRLLNNNKNSTINQWQWEYTANNGHSGSESVVGLGRSIMRGR